MESSGPNDGVIILGCAICKSHGITIDVLNARFDSNAAVLNPIQQQVVDRGCAAGKVM